MELFIALILTAIFLLIVIFPFICFFLLKKLQNHIYEIESQLKLIHDHLLISPEESLKTAAAENIFNPALETADDSDNFADDILRSPQSVANDTDEIKNSALAINDAICGCFFKFPTFITLASHTRSKKSVFFSNASAS